MNKPRCNEHPDAGYFIQKIGVHTGAYCNTCEIWLEWVENTDKGNNSGNPYYVLKSGKHEGKTILQAVQDDKKWAKWCSENLENDYIKESIKQAMRQL